MPSISQHQSARVTKLLVLGDSSAGKTGALAPLAAAGYKLRIIDVDNGLDILRDYLTNPKSPYVQQRKNIADFVEYETITDTMKQQGGRLVPVTAKAWTKVINLLDDWKTPTAAFGNIATWDENDVLVIDTLSILADKALQFILSLNLRLGQRPHQSDWGEAQQLIQGLLEKLYDDAVKCNVVVNCHIRYMEDQNKIMRCFPESAGKMLSPKIGRYFNSVVRVKTVGTQHKIITVSDNFLELKTSSPLNVKPEYPISNGLAQLFADLRSAPAPQSTNVINLPEKEKSQ